MIAFYNLDTAKTKNEKKIVCLPSPYLNIAETTLALPDEEIICVY